MGRPYQRNGKGTWYIKVKGVDGRWRPRATTCAGPTAEKDAKSLARRLNALNEEKRLGIRPMADDPTDCKLILGGLCSWWLDECCSADSREKERNRLEKHIVHQPIGALRLPEVTTEVLEKHWKTREKAGLEGASLNRLRTDVLSAFREAIDLQDVGRHKSRRETEAARGD